jgi:hypothetical protein
MTGRGGSSTRSAAFSPQAPSIDCRPGFFLPVRVLSRLFRRLFLRELENAFSAGKLRFFGKLAARQSKAAFSDNQPMHLMVEHASLGVTPVKPEAAGGGGLKGQALRA